MKFRRSTALLLIIGMLALLLAGCGSSSSYKESAVEAPMAAPMYEAAYDYEYDGALSEESLAVNTASGSTVSSLPQNRKFIITVSMDTETEDMDALLAALNAKIGSLSGYIEDQNIYNGSTYSSSRRYRSANLTVRVPVQQLDAFTEEVKGLANVTSASQSTQDVTLRYVDTQSRVTALETERDRLLTWMEEAETMQDLLEIEARLTEVRYQLEQYSSQLRVLDNQVDFATIDLNIREVQEYTPVAEQTLWERISEGFQGSLKDIGEFFEDLFAWLIIDLPYLLLLAAVIFAIVFLSKRGYRKHKAKKMAKYAAQYQAMQTQQQSEKTE